ncbi:MAG: Gfo/Idh/MocA family oxidoreductase, partial [Rhizobiales bacterium]|nr:Gfo/Idh/MocA family oxidoreductase [Hyphomicrobiales bacterium]
MPEAATGPHDPHPDPDAYALATRPAAAWNAPELPYRPSVPRAHRPGIGLIGAGGIAFAHLDAYRRAGYRVLAIGDRHIERAQARRDAFFPDADATDDIGALLARDDIEIIDITIHPEGRAALIEAAIDAGKHVLSQKPFVLDLDLGDRLVARADAAGVRLAVNQNGRWAPHLAYMREAVRAGLVGELMGVHAAVHWDHRWIAGTPFEAVDDLVLFDFGIHWFDFLASLIGERARHVRATRTRAAGQTLKPPMLAEALVAFDGGQASLIFDGVTPFGPLDTTYVAGTLGSLSSTGPSLSEQAVTFTTAAGAARPALVGSWFNDGFHGTMAELICAIEDGREPQNGARANLTSLALCFAAIASANSGEASKACACAIDSANSFCGWQIASSGLAAQNSNRRAGAARAPAPTSAVKPPMENPASPTLVLSRCGPTTGSALAAFSAAARS